MIGVFIIVSLNFTFDMPKSSPHTPGFMKERLSSTKMDLIRDCFPNWLQKSKDRLEAEPKFSMDAVHEMSSTWARETASSRASIATLS